MAIGDLNGDGYSDLAVANEESSPYFILGTVSVLLGNGDGSFGDRTDYGVGRNPISVAIGDLNGDGHPDLAAANSYENTISVMLGRGDGSFEVKTDFGAGVGPRCVAIADVNRDGKTDLAVANYYDNTVSVLLGNGDGSFRAKTDFGTGTGPFGVAIGDLNRDGKPDLATVNINSNTVSALLGSGTGSFGAKADFDAGDSPISMAMGDLNGDGKPDLAVASQGSYPYFIGTVSVLLGNGDGSLGAKTDFGTWDHPYFVAMGDLNGDDKADLAVASEGSYPYFIETVSVVLGDGDGGFGAKADFGAGLRPYSVAIGDLNADGMSDVAVANNGSNTVSVLPGNGDGTFGVKPDFGTGNAPVSVAIGDLNGDGKRDLATANNYSNTASVLLANGDGSFGTKTDFGSGGVPKSVAIGDLNGDGEPDLAVANYGPYPDYIGTLSVLLGNGDGSFGAKTDYSTGTGSVSLAIGDLNDDGKPDVAVVNHEGNEGDAVLVLLGNGDGSFGVRTGFGAGIGPRSVAISDLSGDGKPDLAVANFLSHTVSVLLGNGDGSFGAKTDFGTGHGPNSVAIGDLNSDGKPDLAVANADSNTVSVLLGNGDGSFGTKTDYGTGAYPFSVAIGDLTADGKPDLAVANGDGNTVSVLLGDGDGGFGLKTDYGTGRQPLCVAIGDLNGDGKPDLAVANALGNTITVLRNVGVVIEPPVTPTRFELARPHPNPFGSSATLDFAIPRSAFVRLEIHDAQGRQIRTIQRGVLPPGHYTRSWDGATTSGSAARPGVYFVHFSAPGVELSRKALLIR